VHHDRDVNAAINLKDLAVSSTVIACGGTSGDPMCKRKVKPVSAKQESNGKKA
jgi:putative transposase